MTGLHTRNLLPELMDQPGLHDAEHGAALAGLRRVNIVTRSVDMLWPSIERVAAERVAADSARRPTQPIRILDVACGGGDVTCGFATRGEQRGLSVQVSGCDISPFAISYAQEFADRNGHSDVDFFVHDILNEDLAERYDFVVSSLFLHHLDQNDARTLLQKMGESAQRGVFISDLRRTRFGYAMAYVGTRLLSRSPIVHYDGPQSVAGAFTCEEALQIAHHAGWTDAAVQRQWPQRFLLSWNKPSTSSSNQS